MRKKAQRQGPRKHGRKRLLHLQQLRHNSAAFAVAACFGVGVFSLTYANPTNPLVVNGAAQFTTTGNLLSISNSPNAIINWGSFSIGANEITRFVQQSTSSAVLNRVVGQNPSSILGALQSNGRVFVINPNGIVFGAGSQINVGGLVASTLNLSNEDFLAGRMRFTEGSFANSGNSLINSGNITTPSGGNVYLIGNAVTNNGIITSPKGDVILAAGKSVELVNPGTPDLRVEIVAPDNQALNLGQIAAESGRIGIYAGLINQAGTVNANSVVVGENGQIILKATKNATLEAGSSTTANGPSGSTVTVQSGDTTLVYGDVEAKGAQGQGGDIKILGNLVGLAGNASVDASGEAGGGSVLVGGDFQGRNSDVRNAFRTYVGENVNIKADAGTTGDGGKVVVWADDVTRYYGNISARGGAQSGDGGNVEVSGHRTLDYGGFVNAGAPHGKAGTLLLDPSDITIVDDATGNNNINLGVTFTASSSPATLKASTLVAQLNAGGANVTVDASPDTGGVGTITVNEPIAYNSANDLTFLTPGNTSTNVVTINQSITNAGSGNLLFDAGFGSLGSVKINNADLNLNGGNIEFNVSGHNYTAILSGTVNITAASVVSLVGFHVAKNSTAVINGDLNPAVLGVGALDGGNASLTVNGNYASNGGGILIGDAANNYTGNSFVVTKTTQTQGLTIHGSTAQFNGGITLGHSLIMSGAGAKLSGGDIDMTNGSGSAAMNWSAGTIDSGGKLTTAAGITSTIDGAVNLNRNWTINGGAQITGAGAVTIGAPNNITIANDAKLTIAAGSTVPLTGGTVEVNGELINNRNGARIDGVTLNNNATGTVRSQNVGLTLGGGTDAKGSTYDTGTSGTGGFGVLSITRINNEGNIRGNGLIATNSLGGWTLNNASTTTIDSTIRMDLQSGSIAVNGGPVTVKSINVQGSGTLKGTMTGTNALTVTGGLTWADGAIDNTNLPLVVKGITNIFFNGAAPVGAPRILTNVNNDFQGEVRVANYGTNATQIKTIGVLNFGGVNTTNGDLTVDAVEITQNTTGLKVGGTSTFNAGTGSIALSTSTSNNFTGTVTLNATGPNVSVTGTNAINLGTPTLGPNTGITAIAGTVLALPAANLSTGTGNIDLRSKGGALPTNGTLTTTSGAVNLAATGVLSIGHDITTSGGNLTLTGAGVNQTAGKLLITGTMMVNGGAGAVTLMQASNDFTGAVSLTGGVTQITDTNALTLGTLNTGNLTVTSTGALNLGQGNVGGTLNATSNNNAITQTGALVVTGAATLNAGTSTINLPITANDFQAAVTPTGSSVTLADSSALTINPMVAGTSYDLTSGGNLVVEGNATALTTKTTGTGTTTFQNVVNITNNLGVTSAGAVGQSGLAPVTLTVGGTTSINAGANAISLSDASNDFTGTVLLANSGAGNNVSIRDKNTLTLAPSTVGGSLTVTSTGTTLNGDVTSGGAQTYGDNVTIATNNATLSTTNSNVVFGGNVVLTQKALTVSNGSGDTTFKGTVTTNGSPPAGIFNALTVNSSGITTFNAPVNLVSGLATDPGGSTVINGGSITTVNGMSFGDAVSGNNVSLNSGFSGISAQDPGNQFTGTLNLAAGLAQVSNSKALSATLNTTGPTTLQAGGNLNITGNSGNLTTTTTNAGTTNFGAATTTVTGNLDVTSGGAISQSGPLIVTGTSNINAGANPVSLAGANDFGGALTVTGASAIVNDTNALTVVLNTNGANTLTAGGAIVVTGSYSNINAATTGAGASINLSSNAPDLTVTGATTNNGNITLGGVNLTLAGDITTGTGALNTTATGTQTLQKGVLTLGDYTIGAGPGITLAGGTLIVTGALIVGNSATLNLGNSSPPQTINVGNLTVNGTLAGTGTINTAGGTGTVVNNGVVAPGNSPGTLNIVGNFTTSGLLSIEVGGLTAGTEFDRINVTGNTSLGGMLHVLQLSPPGTFVPPEGSSFRIINTLGTSTGNFSSTNFAAAFAGMSVRYGSTFTDLLGVSSPSNPPSNNNLLVAMKISIPDDAQEISVEEAKKAFTESTCK